MIWRLKSATISSSFHLWVGMGCSRLLFGRFTREVAVSVEMNFFFFRTDIWLVRNGTSAEKPRGFAVRQESKIIRINIIETRKKREEAKILSFHLYNLIKQQSQVTVVNNRFSKLCVVGASDVILSIILMPQ